MSIKTSMYKPLFRPHHSDTTGLYQQLRRKCLRVELQYHLRYLAKWVAALLFIFYVLNFSCGNFWTKSNMKTIMLWNSDNGFGLFGKYLSCNCVFTDYHNIRHRVIDAIVFSGDKPYTLVGLAEKNTREKYLSVYMATQPMSELHPPPTYNTVAPYNLTMTFRKDSDVILGHYFVRINDTERPCTKFRQPSDNYMNDMTQAGRTKLRQMLDFKSRLAVYTIFPVTFRTKFKSEILVRLRYFIELDAYENCNSHTDCLPYKFMLVFNTAHCCDYIEPDFFAALKNYIVPVVFNGTYYSRHAPPLSFINAADFDSMGELAYHLKRISLENDSYKRYFWWRAYYAINNPIEPYCALCRILNNQTKLQRSHNDQGDFMKWWFKTKILELENNPN